jgi:hypothetical protein
MLPKTGKVFPRRAGDACAGDDYAVVIGTALREELGNTHQSVKTVMSWTGASERTVKNWFAGASGPSGAHLIAIVRHSDAAFAALMVLAGRNYALAAKKLVDARNTLAAMLEIIVSLTS